MRARFALLLLVGLLVAPDLALAQSATPAASPPASPVASCKPAAFCTSPGFIERVWRLYEYVGTTYAGPQQMQFGIAQFDSADDASAAINDLLVACAKPADPAQDASNVTLVSLLPQGDESRAVAGQVLDPQPHHQPYLEACIIVRTGAYLRFAYVWGWIENPMPDALYVLSQTISRSPSTRPVKTVLGVSSGGLWDAIPTLTDLPQGHHVIEESKAS